MNGCHDEKRARSAFFNTLLVGSETGQAADSPLESTRKSGAFQRPADRMHPDRVAHVIASRYPLSDDHCPFTDMRDAAATLSGRENPIFQGSAAHRPLARRLR